MYLRGILLLSLLATTIRLNAQANLSRYFAEVQLRIDTAVFSWKEDQRPFRNESRLGLEYLDESPEVELLLTPNYWNRSATFRIMDGPNYTVLDSLRWVNDAYYLGRLRLDRLGRGKFPTIFLQLQRAEAMPLTLSIPLLPITNTQITWRNPPPEIFIGEEYSFNLEANWPQNVRIVRNWTEQGSYYYRLIRPEGKLRLLVQGHRLGMDTLRVPLRLRHPYRDSSGQLRYHLPNLNVPITVQRARLRFLGINQRAVVLKNGRRPEAIEVEMAYDPRLETDKTYRIEGQEAPGGFLIAELFTRERLANGRMLCWLRPYDYHRRQEGYLYIKDGDEALFLSNLDILPVTTIQEIAILREGEDWKNGTAIYPGERISIRLRGASLNRAELQFPHLEAVQQDTLERSEGELVYEARVPIDIRQPRVDILNRGEPTGKSLRIQERQRAHALDFLDVRINDTQYALDQLDKIQFVSYNTDDIVIGLRRDLIDRDGLYGPQELSLRVEVRDRRNQLVEQKELKSFTICPSSSPREAYYNNPRCRLENISLNSLLRKRVIDLDPWSTIYVTISHSKEKYGNQGYSRTAEFVLAQRSNFDIDISFPAGLVIKRLGEPGFGNLGGISMAMIAQLSFFQPQKVARAKPYKFGAGFLALNAFNFNENNNNRDVGLVVLGSLYPVRTKYSSRLSFPLFAGGGYFLGDSEWFFLLGPGIRVRL